MALILVPSFSTENWHFISPGPGISGPVPLRPWPPLNVSRPQVLCRTRLEKFMLSNDHSTHSDRIQFGCSSREHGLKTRQQDA